MKKTWTNWAAQRGLIDPCKGEHTCASHSRVGSTLSILFLKFSQLRLSDINQLVLKSNSFQLLSFKAPTKPSSVVLARKEQKKVVEVLLEEEEEEDVKKVVVVEEIKEAQEQNKEKEHGQKKIITSVVIEKVDENNEEVMENESTQKELVSKDLDISPLDPDTETCEEKIAADTAVALKSIEVQFANSPDKSSEEKICTDEKIGEEERCQAESLISGEVSEDNGEVRREEDQGKVGGSSEKKTSTDNAKEPEGCDDCEDVIAEEKIYIATEEESSGGGCRQEACLVHHQPEIVTDAEETCVGKNLSSDNKDSVPREIAEEIVDNAFDSGSSTNTTDPEPSKHGEDFPLEENPGWDEEETWEDYDSEFDLEDCRQGRIPAYVEFEIGVWSSALWTSDMKWEKPAVEVEVEEVDGWGVPFDGELTNTSSFNGTWSSGSSSGDEGARKDTFDESDFCDSPVNSVDDSVSTDEGIVASDDEGSENLAVGEKKKKVIVDETSPGVVINAV